MEDLDALLAELEQNSRLASKDHRLQAPSSCKQDPGRAPHGHEPLASASLKVQLPPRAQPPGEASKTVYSSPIQAPQPLLPSPPTTVAAQQLDELLADLGHMQSKLAAVGQGAGAPAEPSLDNMLGSLTRDLQELGITAAPAGTCAACRKPIAGKVLTALDQTWHPEHFFCAHCGKVFGDDGFHERSGKPYCRQDFLAMFALKCQGCDRPVTDNYLSALQGVWHPECFVCAVSGRQ
ncbi:leupaxin, partial [Egretta garzetta]|uniref:leupaxin n=1 Tax=Egretta garzetta TaxID=188379 RepID=UPI00163C9BEE